MNRPIDTWRVCGHRVDDTDTRGCTCNASDPTPMQAAKAAERLAQEDTVRP